MALVKLVVTSIILIGFSWAQAAEKCEYVFSEGPSAYLESSRKFIGNEFNLVLNDANMVLFDRIVNKQGEYNLADQKEFFAMLRDLGRHDVKQKREVEILLDRKVSFEEATALRIARGLGRTEKGLNEDLLAFGGNYTKDQIVRKDRVLELAGFSLEERMALQGNKLVDDILTRYTADNLIWDNISETPAQAVAMNKELISQMNQLSQQVSKDGKKSALTAREAKKLYEEVTRHPITRLLNVKKYDPDSAMGFCFGRAMTAHFEALRLGVAKESIRKVYVVGAMKALVGDIIWQFHVATAIKGADGGWWVVDPFFGKVVKLEKWYERMYSHDTKGTLRIYASDATRLGATSGGHYEKAHLMMDYYNGYFKDLFKYYDLKAKNEVPAKPLRIKLMDWALSVINLGI
ncbi:hypothetical protein [Bdellovibrio sp. HCB209]|uniref:hypothetical protein n=1 Tax=Bdellovibrio sp. HCB209 TaxID=3394354 RepID=UPI0039B4CF6B